MKTKAKIKTKIVIKAKKTTRNPTIKTKATTKPLLLR